MYIDMQRCEFSLDDYIEFHKGQYDLSSVHESSSSANHVLITKDSSSLMIARNACMIAYHVALGLEYMHGMGLVHRDLRPAHGTLRSCQDLIVSSLLPSR